MTIVIDYEHDEIRFGPGTKPQYDVRMKVKRIDDWYPVMVEMLTMLNHAGVTLKTQDEGELITREEW